MEGYLEKKGGWLGAVWQERFFRLNRARKSLQYFDNGDHRGTLDLHGAGVFPGSDGWTFSIAGPALRHTYVLRLKDGQRRAEWLRALMEVTAETDSVVSFESLSRISHVGATPEPLPDLTSSFDHRALAELGGLSVAGSPRAPPPADLAPTSIALVSAPAPPPPPPRDSAWVQITPRSQRRGSSSSTSTPSVIDASATGSAFSAWDAEEGALSPKRRRERSPPGLRGKDRQGTLRVRAGAPDAPSLDCWCRYTAATRTLALYTSQGGAPLGEWNAEGASIEPWYDGLTFTLRGGGAEHALQCPDPADRAGWLAALRPPPPPVAGGPAVTATVAALPPSGGEGILPPAEPSPLGQCAVCAARFTPGVRAHPCPRCHRPCCLKCCQWRPPASAAGPHTEHARICPLCHQALVIPEAEAHQRRQLAVCQADDWEALCIRRQWREETLAFAGAGAIRA